MLYIFLAAYNEGKNLPAVFEDIKKQGWKFDYSILLVNDGSSDNTSQIASGYSKQMPLTIISHERNMGLGKALQTGFTRLNQAMVPGDLVVTLDADNSHPIEVINSMLGKIEDGADIVIASRYCVGGGQKGLSLIRRALSFGASIFSKLLWPIKNVKDYSCGFRMYRGSLVKSLFDKFGNKFIEETGFSATLEVLLKASLITDKITEVPLTLRYDKKLGASKMKIFKTIHRYFALIFKLKVR
jgi:dolichol-phosphate mannosyltransferase